MANIAVQLSVAETAVLLWQTTTGVSPDPLTTAEGNEKAQLYRAGTFNDPVPIVVANTDDTNPVWLGGSGVTSETGLPLPANESLAYNVVGSDSLYAISGQSGGVAVAVSVGRQ